MISQKKAEESAPSGDLMADLHKKLAMRRKGISGRKDDENTKAQDTPTAADGGGLLNRMSSMIPPPPSKEDTTPNPSEDETDWD